MKKTIEQQQMAIAEEFENHPDFEEARQTVRDFSRISTESIMKFAGSMNGVYGETSEGIDAYIANEKNSWER